MTAPSLTGCMDDDVGTGATRLGSAVSSHTPGPWFVVKHTDEQWTVQDRACGAGNCVAMQYARSSEANARLIAAAPDLYEALKRARAQLVAIGGAPRPDERDFSNQGAVLDAVDAALSQVSDSERSFNVITNEVQS